MSQLETLRLIAMLRSYRQQAAIQKAAKTSSIDGWAQGLAFSGQVGIINLAGDATDANFKDWEEKPGNNISTIGGSIQLGANIASFFTIASNTLSRTVGVVGVTGGLTTIVGDLFKLNAEQNSERGVSVATLSSLVGGVAGVVSGGGLLFIQAAAVAGLATVTLPVIGTVSMATALTIAAVAGMTSIVGGVSSAILTERSKEDNAKIAAAIAGSQFKDSAQLQELLATSVLVDSPGGTIAIEGAYRSIRADAPGYPAPGDYSDVVVNPPDLDTPARNSATFATAIPGQPYQFTIQPGGTASDLWLGQRQAGNDFGSPEAFYKALMANNPEITDINRIPAGAVLNVPVTFADATITYNYAGGTSINTNASGSRYTMVARDPVDPNPQNYTVYKRTLVDNESLGSKRWCTQHPPARCQWWRLCVGGCDNGLLADRHEISSDEFN